LLVKHLKEILACRWFRTGVLVLCLAAAAGGAMGQATPASGDYFEICRRQGYLYGTLPMRRCIDAQRGRDLDPLNALDEYQLSPPDSGEDSTTESDLTGEFPGARQAEALLKSTPERLLLGPDYRAQGQGIYE
jgi:hypothetical protein